MSNYPDWGASQVPFIPGQQLSRRFYWEAVRPLLDHHFIGMPHTAALVGTGSDVLGYDTPRSRDHMWGPRVVLFLLEEDFESRKIQLDEILRANLPVRFLGYPTHFGDPDNEGVRIMLEVEHGPVDHLVSMKTLPGFFNNELGWDASREPGVLDWLTMPEQRLLELTSGEVFHDDLGLNRVRERFAFYPQDVWLYLLASQWMRISQEEPFVGRTGDLGDETGSRILAARLTEDVMRLSFLLERRYAPYSKWFGTAFQRLDIAGRLGPLLEAALQASTWNERQEYLAAAYQAAAEKQNSLGLADTLDTTPTYFYSRPYRVISANRFAEALQQKIQSKELLSLPLYGSVNQITTSTDVLSDPDTVRKMQCLYGG